MSDQPYIFLIVLFLMMGLFAYNQHLVNNGELSLVSQIVDFAGLADYSTKEPSVDVEVVKKQHQLKLQNGLDELNEYHQEIHQKRVALINKRREVLKRIKEVNKQLEKEAETFAEIIDKEREAFINEFPELVEFHKEIVKFQNISDQDLRMQKYEEIKSNLLASIAKISGKTRKADDARLERYLKIIENIVIGQEENDVAYCGGFEKCLNRYVKDIESDVRKAFKKNIKREDVKIAELMDITELLEDEYDMLSKSFESSEANLQKNNQKIESELKYLSEQLVDITEGEFRDLMDLYEELREEQNLVLKNLEISLVRFNDAEERVNSIINTTINKLKNTYGREFNGLVKVQNAWNDERTNLFIQLKSNEKILDQDIRGHWQRTQDMINDMVESRNNIAKINTINAIAAGSSQTLKSPEQTQSNSSKLKSQIKDIRTRDSISKPSSVDMKSRNIRSNISDTRVSDKYNRQFQKYQKLDSPKQQRRDAIGRTRSR